MLFNYSDQSNNLLSDEKEDTTESIENTKGYWLQNCSRLSNWLIVLNEIVSCNLDGTKRQKRQIFYNNVERFTSQKVIDQTIIDICYFMKVPRYSLRIEASGKGLVAGNLVIFTKNYELNQDISIDLRLLPEGFSIKHAHDMDFSPINHIDFVIIVEKDTVFSNLLSLGIFSKGSFFENSILITGKGYPDYNTRYLVRKLFEKNQDIAFFYFGDADPYGQDIYLNY